VGGNSSSEGNVYAMNPDTGVDGPVCDDAWDEYDVRSRLKMTSQIYFFTTALRLSLYNVMHYLFLLLPYVDYIPPFLELFLSCGI
jgi:hypothetical protein